MPGMGSRGLSNGNPIIVAAFHSALFHGLLAVVVVAMVAILIFLLLSGKVPHPLRGSWRGEPVGRRVLRLGFGVLWVVDGLLQFFGRLFRRPLPLSPVARTTRTPPARGDLSRLSSDSSKRYSWQRLSPCIRIRFR